GHAQLRGVHGEAVPRAHAGVELPRRAAGRIHLFGVAASLLAQQCEVRHPDHARALPGPLPAVAAAAEGAAALPRSRRPPRLASRRTWPITIACESALHMS